MNLIENSLKFLGFLMTFVLIFISSVALKLNLVDVEGLEPTTSSV